MSGSGPKRKASDDEILTVFRASDDPVLTAGEVAERVPITRRSVHDRLTALQERGSRPKGYRSTNDLVAID